MDAPGTPLPPAIAARMPFRRVDVRVDGVRLSVVDDGPRDAPAMLFLHGNPAWSYLWRRLLGPAKDAGFRVVAPDLAGFGASDKPTDPAYYSLERHVDNLDAVGRALHLARTTVVLHDWGGPVGMGWAVRNPERVERIVAANTVAFPPRTKRPLSRWHARFASPFGYRLGVLLNVVQSSAMRYGVRKKLERADRAAYRWPMRAKGGRIAAGRFVQLVPDGPDHPTAAALRRIWDDAPKLAHVPVRVLWADADPVFRPKWAERWREAPAQIESIRHVSPGAGHFWQEDDPQPFLREILEFATAKSG